MIRPSFSAAALVAAVSLGSGVAAARTDAGGPLATLRSEGLARSQAIAIARELVDGHGPRLTGSPAMARARGWAMAKLRALGATAVHEEDWGEFGIGWTVTAASLTMVGDGATPLVVQALPWSPATRGTVTAPASLVEIKGPEDFARYRGRLRGRIVLAGRMAPLPPATMPFVQRLTDADIDDGTATGAIRAVYARRAAGGTDRTRLAGFRRDLARFLADEGAAAVVVPSSSRTVGAGTGLLRVDDSYLGGRTWRPETRLRVPAFVATPESYLRLQRLVDDGRPPRLTALIRVRETAHARGANVVADFAGTDPSAGMVVMGAHLDSWTGATGATDDGAGVAIVMEAARLLRAAGTPHRRTLRIVLFDGEEQGLLGSAAYVRRHLAAVAADVPLDVAPVDWAAKGIGWRPRAELAAVAAIYNLDNGGGRIRAVFTNGDAALAPVLKEWIAPLRDLGVTRVLDERDWPADHTSFTALGMPAITFLPDPLDYYTRTHHSDADTFDHLSAPDLAQAATVVAILLRRSLNEARR